jgi:branched-chain amino acid transport system ATP-binding protein
VTGGEDRGLELAGVTQSFAGVQALVDVSFTARPRCITALIGPNGAGKSTLLNVMSSVYRPDSGTVTWQGRELTGLRPDQVAALGVARTFQNLAVSPRASVREVLEQGCYTRTSAGVVANALRTPRARRERARCEESILAAAAGAGLESLLQAQVGGLSYGQRKRLEFARALCLEPSLLLLDEPAAGLNDAESHDLARMIVEARDQFGAAVVLVEHDVPLVLDISDDVVVMDFGRVLSSGPAQRVRDDPHVLAAYLGHTEGVARG